MKGGKEYPLPPANNASNIAYGNGTVDNALNDLYSNGLPGHYVGELTADVLEYALSVKKGYFVPIFTSSSSINLPAQSSAWYYACGFVIRRTDTITVVLFAYGSNLMAMNTYNGSTWVGWTTK